MKVKILFILPAFIILFGSCAVSKYDYYYCVLKPENVNLKSEAPHDNYSVYSGILNSESENTVNELIITITNEDIVSFIKNTNPIYVDYSGSKIGINKDEYSWNSLEKDSFLLINPQLYKNNRPKWQKISKVSFSPPLSIYKQYDEKSFRKDTLFYKNLDEGMEKEILSLEFDKKNSPLKLSLSLSYCKDEKCIDREIFCADFYQSALMKLKNKKKDELASNFTPYSFYVTAYKGKTWGWPEMRKGLGWATTILCLPVTLIIDLVPVVFQGKETGTVPFPLFE